MMSKNRELPDLFSRIDLLVGFTASKVNKKERTTALYEIIRDQDTGECEQYMGAGSFNGPGGDISSVLCAYLNPKSQLLEAVYLPNAEYIMESTGEKTVIQSEKHSKGAFRIEQCNGIYEMIDGKGKIVTNKETIDDAVNTVLNICLSMLQEMNVEKKINDYLRQRGININLDDGYIKI